MFSPKKMRKTFLATLAVALLGASALVACGGGGSADTCNSVSSCKAMDDAETAAINNANDPYAGCWNEGVDKPVMGMFSCQQITAQLATGH